MKIRAVVAKLFHVGARADRQAYMTKLTAAFRNCANAPKIQKEITYNYMR